KTPRTSPARSSTSPAAREPDSRTWFGRAEPGWDQSDSGGVSDTPAERIERAVVVGDARRPGELLGGEGEEHRVATQAAALRRLEPAAQRGLFGEAQLAGNSEAALVLGIDLDVDARHPALLDPYPRQHRGHLGREALPDRV